MPELTAERLRALLTYDPGTGRFVWLCERRGKVGPGIPAGSFRPTGKCRDGSGYIWITIDQRKYVAHRLAWLWMTGSMPALEVDHVNRIKTDNRWANLREATKAQNIANTPANRNNRCGVKGVRWHQKTRKWSARIRVNGRERSLGYFHTLTDADAAYRAAAIAEHGEFAVVA